EVEGIVTNHPAEKEVQPFAPASRRRPWKEVAHGRMPRHAAIGSLEIQRHRARGKVVERFCDVGRRLVVGLDKEPFNWPRAINQQFDHTQECDEIESARPAMDEIRERRLLPCWIEGANVSCWLAPHYRQETLN